MWHFKKGLLIIDQLQWIVKNPLRVAYCFFYHLAKSKKKKPLQPQIQVCIIPAACTRRYMKTIRETAPFVA